jgi:hypothetical protein
MTDSSVQIRIHGTITAQPPKQKGLRETQALDLLVAGTGFEPVTFGL